eukprot:CAMPEP_0184028332 /NCGR_PEP_ID=MMETSP0954-20121128/14760_1 /TAXON_ID=627963 /ORGANISM="Aplanochytrium sp, Strain PBS07" /LENGTH=48 /DNA_ID= /DNA_START= /DNA_END= /DNA_ORIENTATION=
MATGIEKESVLSIWSLDVPITDAANWSMPVNPISYFEGSGFLSSMTSS